LEAAGRVPDDCTENCTQYFSEGDIQATNNIITEGGGLKYRKNDNY